jgi:hypothetical protein
MEIIRQKLLKTNWRVVLLLSAMLFCAQISALEHEVEHLSHGNQELCQSCIAYDTSVEQLSEPILAFDAIAKRQHFIELSVTPSLYTAQFGPIRAPPHSS